MTMSPAPGALSQISPDCTEQTIHSGVLLHKSSSNHNPPDANLLVVVVHIPSIHSSPDTFVRLSSNQSGPLRTTTRGAHPTCPISPKTNGANKSPRPHPICGVRWTARWKLARWISLGHPQRHRIRPRCKVYHSCRRPFPVQWERHRSRCLMLILWLRTPSVAWHPLTRHTRRACHSLPSCVNMSRSPLQWAPLAHSSRTACRPSLVGCRRRCNRL